MPLIERLAGSVPEHPRRHRRPSPAEGFRLPVDLEAPEDAGELLGHVDGAPVSRLRRLDLARGELAPQADFRSAKSMSGHWRDQGGG